MKTSYLIYRTIPIAVLILGLSSCTKEVPKNMMEKNGDKNSQQNSQEMDKQKMPDDDIHRNLQNQTSTDSSSTKGDSKAEELSKAADDADELYMKSKSDADKKTCIEKQLAAANYLMFEANLSPKKKYRPALKRYRRILELDPGNKEAAANKKQIEDIYESMGMPVPD